MAEKRERDARSRLQEAALALFREHGYDRTTAAGIAARAGVTERTFFRHFPDKREALFDGEKILRAGLTDAIADAPAGLSALETLFRAFRSMQPALEANRDFAKPRHELIAATPTLHEREVAKLAALTKALASALKDRGHADLRADLAAQIGMAAFSQATIAWLDDDRMPLDERMEIAFREVAEVLSETR